MFMLARMVYYSGNKETFNMFIISIDYDGVSQRSYSSVKVSDGGPYKEFDCGAAEIDFAAAMYWAYSRGSEIMISSSCDHFVRDGFDYGWKINEYGHEVIFKLTHDEKVAMLGGL